ncbi:hypothetical protein IJJ02_00065 [Candidatus Saccharibacteria bacterium]|nr:hypothetical protein [Candidatus Saccharibacteria bacterium]
MKIILRIIMLTIITISLLFIVSNNVFDNASAESYESNVGVSFTLNPSISVTVSGDLTIANLTPGDYKDSNNITVTANSNSIAGYTLSSTVGSSTNTSTELRKDGVDTTNKFSSITTNKASLSNFDDSTNTWGYSYSTDSGSTWISGDITGTPLTGYNGLPLYTSSNSIKLINSTTSGSSSVLFKIGARTTTNQIAGEYTNVINFIGVANPNPPIVYMQNATLADCGKDMVDSRDNTIYTTALLENGQCWMTKNLDLAGGTALSSADTDATDTYINGFTTGGNLTKVGNTIVLPTSSTTGFDDDTKAFVYNSGRAPASDSGCTNPGCYSYYSWIAATLGGKASDGSTAVTADNTDTAASICPKGWHLPNTRSGTNDTSDYRKLMIIFGGSASIRTYDSTTSPTGAAIFENLSGVSLNFLRGGDYSSGLFRNGGTVGCYWSSTSGSDASALNLGFHSSYVGSASNDRRQLGFSVRCVKSS